MQGKVVVTVIPNYDGPSTNQAMDDQTSDASQEGSLSPAKLNRGVEHVLQAKSKVKHFVKQGVAAVPLKHSNPNYKKDSAEDDDRPFVEREQRRPPSSVDKPVSIACLKLAVLGSCGAGKTALISRFVNGNSVGVDSTEPTIGGMLAAKLINLYGTNVKLSIWDVSGAAHMEQLGHMFYKGAQVVICVYDVSNVASFERAKRWIDELRSAVGNKAVIGLVGTKSDLTSGPRCASPTELQQIAQDNGVYVFEMSAMSSGPSVEKCFHSLGTV
eukprot:TRINITY_DN5121_c2_g1_i3.p1 TRINITY_DN5121_c2_g1~~TRINITY_DN5121_c2_g1_i3.p1  ORF type:complete len:271 (-),score=38.25 TRINITY_DN5121_c2_g1_i3:447-1259(-)